MKTSEGSIFKAKDGKRWVARLQYSDEKGRRQKARYCATFAAAKAKLRELKAEVETLKSDRKTFRELDRFYRREYVHSARFVGGKKLSGFRQSVKIINAYLDAALEYFSDIPLADITFEDLRSYKTTIEEKPLRNRRGKRSMSDTNQHLRRLRRLFTIAVEQGWLDVNPFSRGGSLIQDSFENERTRILSANEETRLLNECAGQRSHLRPILIFAIETAMRRGEMQSVRWSDINHKGKYIKIVGTSTKTLKSRLVPITARLEETLAQLWQKSRKRQSDPVFGVTDFKKAFGTACANSGLHDLRFHDLRHTAITRMLEKGISPPLVMKISGHTQMKTFMRYVNQTEASVFEIAVKLSKAA